MMNDLDFLERTIRFYQIPPPKDVLDFGCGKGASTEILKKIYPNAEVDAVDLGWKTLAPPYDLIVLSAVVEHMLPFERMYDLPTLWKCLKPGGHFLICRTPHRWALWDGHTTGLPGMAFLPDCLADLYVAFGRKKFRNMQWPDLLRAGIRGATISEIIQHCPGGRLLPGYRRLWLEMSGGRRLRWLKQLLPIQSLNIAIKKSVDGPLRKEGDSYEGAISTD